MATNSASDIEVSKNSTVTKNPKWNWAFGVSLLSELIAITATTLAWYTYSVVVTAGEEPGGPAVVNIDDHIHLFPVNTCLFAEMHCIAGDQHYDSSLSAARAFVILTDLMGIATLAALIYYRVNHGSKTAKISVLASTTAFSICAILAFVMGIDFKNWLTDGNNEAHANTPTIYYSTAFGTGFYLEIAASVLSMGCVALAVGL